MIDTATYDFVLEHFEHQQIISKHQQHQSHNMLPINRMDQHAELHCYQVGVQYAKAVDNSHGIMKQKLKQALIYYELINQSQVSLRT